MLAGVSVKIGDVEVGGCVGSRVGSSVVGGSGTSASGTADGAKVGRLSAGWRSPEQETINTIISANRDISGLDNLGVIMAFLNLPWVIRSVIHLLRARIICL
jgi:hypothetical protein